MGDTALSSKHDNQSRAKTAPARRSIAGALSRAFSPASRTKASLKPRMSAKEFALFSAFVKNSARYLEFGMGGSTHVASLHVASWILSTDSSQQWIEKVAQACSDSPIRPELHFADIGPTGDWGMPIDPDTKPRWPSYHEDIWYLPQSAEADLYMVDGRFRVACFAQIILHCSPEAIIGIHDFASRPHYHCVHEIAREIASAEDMSFFQPRPQQRERAAQLLAEFRLNPA